MTSPPTPTFLIIGAQKSGTTSLYHYLSQHPQVFMSPVKEPGYFAFAGQPVDYRGPNGKPAALNAYTVTEWDKYLRLFAGSDNAVARGEASTLYMAMPGTAERIRSQLPNVRLIAILRNPVERAFSSFLHCRRSGREPYPDFNVALAHEQERIEQRWGFLWRYESLGHYYEQLVPYFDLFPREQILMLRYDDLIARPQELMSNILTHIGADAAFRIDSSEKHNVSGEPKNVRLQAMVESPSVLKTIAKPLVPDALKTQIKRLVQRHNLTRPAMPASARERLQHVYCDEIIRLQELTGLDLSTWLKTEGR
jgi:hypothetical protein